MTCKDCLHYRLCYLIAHYDADEDCTDCDEFVPFDKCELVVRCKDCIHSSHPEERIVWCKRRKTYMPLKGFCSDGKEKE